MSRSFAGAGTALITPFTKTGALDEPALRRLVRRQVDAHIDVLVPCGTTGEAATMTVDEQKRVVAITLEEASPVVMFEPEAEAAPVRDARADHGPGGP